MDDAEAVWQMFLARRAATPKRDWHKVARLLFVSKKDVSHVVERMKKAGWTPPKTTKPATDDRTG